MEDNMTSVNTNDEFVLTTDNIVKVYRGHKVLDNVSMHIKKGDIYGFVGENGAGKTTIIRVVTGLIFANSGSFTLFGVSSKSPEILKARTRTSAIVEAPSIYLNLSAFENLKMQMIMLGLPVDENRIKEILNIVGLADVNTKKQSVNYSLGMRQRLGIAMCLVNNPEFMILDEPLNGLDPEGIVSMRNLILKLNKEHNITFLISSHILTELALVATKYGIISKGKLIKEITKEELDESNQTRTIIETSDNSKAYSIIKDLISNKMSMDSNSIVVYGDVEMNEILKALMTESISINNIKKIEASIEDFYISTIGGARNE